MKVTLLGIIEQITQDDISTKGKIKYIDNVTKTLNEILFKDTKQERNRIWKKCFDNKFYINIQAEMVITKDKNLLSITNLDPLVELNLLIKKNDELKNKEQKEEVLDIIGDL